MTGNDQSENQVSGSHLGCVIMFYSRPCSRQLFLFLFFCLLVNVFIRSRQCDDVNAHPRSDQQQKNLYPDIPNEKQCRGEDGDPQQDNRPDLGLPRNTSSFKVRSDVFAEQAVVEQPVVKPLRASGKSPCCKQKKGSGRQQRYEDAKESKSGGQESKHQKKYFQGEL